MIAQYTTVPLVNCGGNWRRDSVYGEPGLLGRINSEGLPKGHEAAQRSSAMENLTPAALSGSSARLIEPPAVLFVVRGMILTHTLPIAVNAVPVTINQDMKALTPREGFTADFLALVLRGAESVLLSRVDSAGHGTGGCRLSRGRNCRYLSVAGFAGRLSLTEPEKSFAADRLPDKSKIVRSKSFPQQHSSGFRGRVVNTMEPETQLLEVLRTFCRSTLATHGIDNTHIRETFRDFVLLRGSIRLRLRSRWRPSSRIGRIKSAAPRASVASLVLG